jgi:hypothetical protein
MTLMDLQGLKAPAGILAPSILAGSGLTVATCASVTPSNLSVALCH